MAYLLVGGQKIVPRISQAGPLRQAGAYAHTKETVMNTDILKGKWQQLRGEIKQRWARLTDDDITYIDGAFDKLIGKVQERYGETRERAEHQCRSFLKKLDQPNAQKAGA